MSAATNDAVMALAPSVDAVRRRLEQVAADPNTADTPWTLPVTPGSRLDTLRGAFGLSEFETSIVTLAAGIELAPGLDLVCAALAGSPQASFPTFGLATTALPGAHWDAFAPDAALRRLHLVELDEGPVLTQRAVRIAERVLHALLGLDALDPRLARRCHPRADVGPLPPSHETLAERIGRWVQPVEGQSDGQSLAQVRLWSADLDMATDVAIRALAVVGKTTYVIDATAVPADAADNDLLAALWSRELALADAGVVLMLSAGLDPVASRSAEAFAAHVDGPLITIAREPPRTLLHGHRLEVPPLPFDETLALWKDVLADGPQPGELVLRDISAQFSLGPSAIRRTAQELREHPQVPATPTRQRLWHACRAIARPRMADLAQHVDVRATLDDLVLPAPQLDVLQALVGQVRHRATVFHAWGFAGQQARGSGLSAVFAGPSGTGKTMAAEAIANALELDLYRIDLSAVVSKYIGETEENLRQVFDAAEAGGAVLLFDEADALFGKRTEVRDSHDRHANIEVSYLLQRMETYAGLAILTTNLRKSIDDAFLRRVQFIVEFPFPEASLRAQIWRGAFPRQTPRDTLDYDKLGQLSVAGGNIRSIVRNAAYIAAGDAEPVRMSHILKAARLEFDKLGRSLPPAEIRGWVA
ncbi:MAG: AAA family ATPase [Nannocystaceae bacterium]